MDICSSMFISANSMRTCLLTVRRCSSTIKDRHPRFNKLIAALRTAVENGNGYLDKEATSHDDLMDAFRLSQKFWH